MKTQLRQMRPNDVPAVLHLLKEQNHRDGTSYTMPKVFDAQGVRLPNIPLALVAVDVETGIVMQGHVYATTIEGMTFGVDPHATVCSMKEHEAVYWMLRERGFKDLHTLVPLKRVKDLRHGLDSMLGMIDTGETLRHFYRLLDPAENDELRNWYQGETQ